MSGFFYLLFYGAIVFGIFLWAVVVIVDFLTPRRKLGTRLLNRLENL